jgi:hypothetical protein
MKITYFILAMSLSSIALPCNIPAEAQNIDDQQASKRFNACIKNTSDTAEGRLIASYLPALSDYTPNDLADNNLVNDDLLSAISVMHRLAVECRDQYLTDVHTVAPETWGTYKSFWALSDDNYNSFISKKITRGAYLSRRKDLIQNMSTQLPPVLVKEKGIEYASQSGTSWDISRTKNEMTDKIDVVAQSTQTNDQGVVARLKVFCATSMEVTIDAMIVDQNGNATVEFPKEFSRGALAATRRVNDGQPQDGYILSDTFSNQFVVMRLLLGDKGQEKRQNTFDNWTVPYGTTWRYMIEITTNLGIMLIKIPVYQDQIQQVIKSCE